MKSFIRLDYQGRRIPSSLILRKNKPKVGKWVEVDTFECCNGTTTTSSTTAAPLCVTYFISVGRRGGTLTYTDCGGDPMSFSMSPYATDTFCALENTAAFTGDGIFFIIASECLITTTTTTAEPMEIYLSNYYHTGNPLDPTQFGATLQDACDVLAMVEAEEATLLFTQCTAIEDSPGDYTLYEQPGNTLLSEGYYIYQDGLDLYVYYVDENGVSDLTSNECPTTTTTTTIPG